jgi:hypothetical protein
MAAHEKPPVGLRLWPQTYSVARLFGVPDPLPRLTTAGAPVVLIVGHDEVSLLAPEEVVRGLGPLVERASEGWRAFTVEAVVPLETVGLLAVASRALADVGVPVLVFSSHDTDHFLVPAGFLGRALAVLNQVGLEQFLPEA